MKRGGYLTRTAPMRRRGKTSYARRERNWDFMGWVKLQPCFLAHHGGCGGTIEADHCGDRGLGQKATDETCVPLCTTHHRQRTDMRGLFTDFTAAEMRDWRYWAIARTQAAYARYCGVDAVAEEAGV